MRIGLDLGELLVQKKGWYQEIKIKKASIGYSLDFTELYSPPLNQWIQRKITNSWTKEKSEVCSQQSYIQIMWDTWTFFLYGNFFFQETVMIWETLEKKSEKNEKLLEKKSENLVQILEESGELVEVKAHSVCSFTTFRRHLNKHSTGYKIDMIRLLALDYVLFQLLYELNTLNLTACFYFVSPSFVPTQFHLGPVSLHGTEFFGIHGKMGSKGLLKTFKGWRISGGGCIWDLTFAGFYLLGWWIDNHFPPKGASFDGNL